MGEHASTQHTGYLSLFHPQTHTILYCSSLDEVVIKVFYNSEFAFSSRLYACLDVDLPRIKFYQPLSELTQQSLLYIRDMIPQTCFRSANTSSHHHTITLHTCSHHHTHTCSQCCILSVQSSDVS